MPTRTWLMVLLVWGSAVLFALMVSYFYNASFWLCFVIVAIALVLNGFLAEIEDRWPGGFFNPLRKKSK